MAVPETGVKPIQYFDDPADYFRQLYDDERDVSYHLADWQAYKASGLSPSEYYGYDTVEFSGPTSIKKKGSNVNLIDTASSQLPTYRSDWDDTADALAKAALEMQYDDWAQGDQYKALAERYGEQGKLSMQDLLGQMASRTGGLASSYAEAVAGQQYNDYMAQLEDAARQMYNNERGNAIQNAQMALGYAQNDYERYLNALNQANYEREWANTLDQQNYQRSQNERADAQSRISNYLAMGGNINDIDPSLLSAAGYTSAEVAALGSYYNPTPKAVGSPSPSPSPQPTPTAENSNSSNKNTINSRQYQNVMGKINGQGYTIESLDKLIEKGNFDEKAEASLYDALKKKYYGN